MEQERVRKRKSKNKKMNIKPLIYAVAGIAVVVLGWFSISNASFGSPAKVTYGAESKTAYSIYDNGYIQYSISGAKYFKNADKMIWSDSYTMTAPVAQKDGDYTVIFESEGRTIRLYNSDGLVYSVQTNDPILNLSLNENGYVSVVTSSDTYYVVVYSASGNMLFQRVEAETGVYPVSCDVSPDGSVAAISYIDTTGIGIESKIGMFYVNSAEGKDYENSMFLAVEKYDEIVFEIYFTGADSLVAIGDRNVFSLSTKGVEQWAVEMTNQITNVGRCADKIAIVYGSELSDKDGEAVGTLIYISSKGKVTKGYSIGQGADYMTCSNGGVVIGSGTKYYGINSSGKMVWSLNTHGDVTDIYPTKNINTCIYVTKTWAIKTNMTEFDVNQYSGSVETDDEADDLEEVDTDNIAEDAVEENVDNPPAEGGEESDGNNSQE